MNVTELARQLKIPTTKLKEIMPELGFDIGAKAIKIPPKTAQAILSILSRPENRDKYLKEKDDESVESVETGHTPSNGDEGETDKPDYKKISITDRLCTTKASN